MTLTVSSTCTNIVVDSDLFNITNISNSIAVKINGGTAITLTPSASASSYTITPELLNLTTLTEGVYDITLSVVLVDNSVATEQGCAPVICDLLCKNSTLSWYTNTNNMEKVLALEGLKVAANCETCGCSLMLGLYNTLTNDTTTTCGCGCS